MLITMSISLTYLTVLTKACYYADLLSVCRLC